MSKRNLKYIVFLVITIIVLFVVSLGVVYIIKSDQENSSVVNSKDVTYEANTNTIIIKSIISVSDDFGKNISEENGGAFGYLTFSVVNNVEEKRDYQIYITKLDNAMKEINPNYIRFYLTDSSNTPLPKFDGNSLPSYHDLRYLDDKADSKLIYSGTLDIKEKKNFTLRVWIDDSYVVSEEESVFSFEIDAQAV